MEDKAGSELRKNFYISVIFLIFLLSFNFIAWQVSRVHYKSKATEKFNEYSDDIVFSYSEKANRLSSFLDFGGYLFRTSNGVTRKVFEDFYSELIANHNKEFDNINFIAYIEKVTDKNKFETTIRNEETAPPFKNILFSIYPKTDKSEYWVTNYMTPDDQNKTYFGYDILSDTEFSDYFKKSAKEGLTMVTDPKVFINHEQILMIKPIYDQKQPLRNNSERLKALNGFIVLFVNPDTLFSSVSDTPKNDMKINVHVYIDHIQKNQMAKTKLMYEDTHGDLGLKTDTMMSLEHFAYSNLGDREITIYTQTNMSDQLGLFEGTISDVIFITSNILIIIFFLMMVDMNSPMALETETKL